MSFTTRQRIALGISVLLGGIAGGVIRLIASYKWTGGPHSNLVMTLSFLVFGPIAVGYITVSAAEAAGARTWLTRSFLPWPSIVASVLIAYLVNLEGLICVAFALPITLVFSSIGGIAAGIMARVNGRLRRAPMACILVLPLISPPLESGLASPTQIRNVETTVVIHATPAVVWQHIERVAPIAPSELRPTWTHSIGFPRPIQATLSYEGVGGVRHATFEHGLLFIETITDWEPNHLLSFSIAADTKDIPPTTLDEHVRIGGPYFDVLRGEYRIEPRSDGTVTLHLSSQERLSTNFNDYAGLWSDAVMKSLQNSILAVVKARCEATAASSEQ
jgi:hypothetical protein